jgi:Gnt-I system low-affinity gluconate transporter
MNYQLLLAVLGGIALILGLIVWAKWPAFIALLTGSIAVGLLAGMPADVILKSIEKGMGNTLGYVATIVGLGAIFGGILEKTNGSQVIARYLLQVFGLKRASTAMAVAGFIIAIPVFFDVAFIILFPVLGALQRKTGKSILHFALPLLAGLAVAHAFIPPTPGPIAVANIIGADLGLVILAGILVGFPTALISGVWFGRYIAEKVPVQTARILVDDEGPGVLPPTSLIFSIVFLPILLILCNTCISADLFFTAPDAWKKGAMLLGHPFTALLIANILAWYLLGKKMGFSTAELSEISTKSFQPAGIIILLTGAGGVFKQILVDTGAGEMMAKSAEGANIPLLLFAFVAAAIIRLLQGSATVAMATAASIVAPMVVQSGISGMPLAAVVIAISSGASIMSHVNDSGFWLVKEYLGLTEKQTFRTWSMMTTVLAFTGLFFALLVYTVS